MTAWSAAREPTRLSVTRMISALLGSRPEYPAPAEERAAWFEQKAEVFTRIADVNEADGDVVRASEARVMAAEARIQAEQLQAEPAGPVACLPHHDHAQQSGSGRARERFKDSDFIKSDESVDVDDDGLP